MLLKREYRSSPLFLKNQVPSLLVLFSMRLTVEKKRFLLFTILFVMNLMDASLTFYAVYVT